MIRPVQQFAIAVAHRFDVSTLAAPAANSRHVWWIRWILKLGPAGLFGISIVDSSPIPLPIPGATDILLVIMTVRGKDWWWVAGCAFLGSVVGGYLTYRLGLTGGDHVLHRHISERKLKKVERYVQQNSFLSLFVPALLPPPVPTMPFLLVAGALSTPRKKFFFAYGLGRAIRYGLVGWLGALYGRSVVHTIDRWTANFSTPVTWAMRVMMVSVIGFFIWMYVQEFRHRGKRKAGAPEPSATGVAA